MLLKFIRNGDELDIYECARYRVRQMSDAIIIRPVPGPEIRLDREGDTLYVENNFGKTVDTYRWGRSVIE